MPKARLIKTLIVTAALGASIGIPVALASDEGGSEPVADGPSQAEITASAAQAEASYMRVLEEEQQSGACQKVLESGADSEQCVRIVNDVNALKDGTYEPEYSPEDFDPSASDEEAGQ